MVWAWHQRNLDVARAGAGCGEQEMANADSAVSSWQGKADFWVGPASYLGIHS